jgi:hypothetical protein
MTANPSLPAHDQLASEVPEDAAALLWAEIAAIKQGIETTAAASVVTKASVTELKQMASEHQSVLQALAASCNTIATSPALKKTLTGTFDELATLRKTTVKAAQDAVAATARQQHAEALERNERLVKAGIEAGLNTWRAVWLAAPLVSGFILYPLLAANMPGGRYLASWATGYSSPWTAGSALMSAHDPDSWDSILKAWNAAQKPAPTNPNCHPTGVQVGCVGGAAGSR